MRILVTGGAKRLGKVICKALAREGASLAIHCKESRDEAEQLVQELNAAKPKTEASYTVVAGDLSDLAVAAGLIDLSARALGGPLTALFNNASVFDYDVPTAMKPEVFQQAMNVNLAAPLLLSQAMFAQAEPNIDTLIVDLLDQKLWNLNPDFYSYTLSKAALHSAIEMRAVAFSPKVRVCGIAPGLLFPSFDQTEQEFREVASHNLNLRPIDPEDVGRAAVTLLHNRSFNGQVLHVDNGQFLSKRNRDVMFAKRVPQ
jgi:NAD(P)-dependent dehydrogenase (short-subunit alcohol dehydrogenase family)